MDKNHEIGWVGDGPSLKRDICFFYDNIHPPLGSPNPSHRISVINEGPIGRPDWYYRIHDANKLVTIGRHFDTADEAETAGIEYSRAMPKGLQLRRYEWYSGKEAFTVDGINDYDADVTILEFELGDWRSRTKHGWWSKPWLTREDAFAAFQGNPNTTIAVRPIQLEGHIVYRVYGHTDCEVLIMERSPGFWFLRTMMDNGTILENHDPAWTCPMDALTL